jgi:hypothetical protein
MVFENERKVNFGTYSHLLVRDFMEDKLNKTHQRIPAHYTKIIAGDLNAKNRSDLAKP